LSEALGLMELPWGPHEAPEQSLTVQDEYRVCVAKFVGR
jgi:hypothetical protein